MKGILYNPKRPVTKDTVYQLAFEMHNVITYFYQSRKGELSPRGALEKIRDFQKGEIDAYKFCMNALNELQFPFVKSEFLECLQGWIEHYHRKIQANAFITDGFSDFIEFYCLGYVNALRHIKDFVNTGLDNCFPVYGGDVCTKR